MTIRLHDGALTDSRLTHMELRVLVTVAGMADENDEVVATNEAIANACGVPRVSAQQAISHLREHGYLTSAFDPTITSHRRMKLVGN